MDSKGKILVVDDSLTNIKILMRILTEFVVESATSGEDALRKALILKPDLVLLDIVMPGMDGYEVCRKLRSDACLTNTKIIMVSARMEVSDRLKGYEVGADDYITKPFDVDELLAKVKVYLRLKSVEEVDRLKDDLIKLLRLEINNPLNCIMGSVDMLRENEELVVDERRIWLNIIKRGATSLQELFEKIETLSILKSGKVDLPLEPADLCTVVRDVVTTISPKAKASNVFLKTQFVDNAISLLDRTTMARVIGILLDNAIRFSSTGGEVQTRIKKNVNDIILEITDEGSGIDPEFLPYIFDEFSTRNIKKHGEGHGLSLAIAQHIVLEHQGRIDVESVERKGTTVTVRLPIVTTDRLDATESD